MTRRRLIRSLAVLTLLLSFCAFPFAASAQTATATLSGTVLDPNGAVVPGANITLIEVTTGVKRILTTNDQGYFTIPLLKPSTYLLQIEHQGFLTAEVKDLVLNVGDQQSLRIPMKIGDVKETVNVTGEAPLINESPAVATTVDRQFVGNLPLNGRSFQSLITLTPGVVLTNAQNGGNPGQFSVNGQRTDTNYFTIDGVSANFGANNSVVNSQGFSGAQPALAATGGTNNLVSVDALQEFKVQTNSYAPEFGRSPGAQVQIATRSGTKDFHGTLFEYFRNDVLDASDWFVNAQRLPKPALRQNDFGFVLGGPVLLPRFGEGGHQPWYNGRKHTFFFVSYEGLHLRQPQVATKSVPSLTLRQQAAVTVQPYINALPQPNGPELINQLTGQPTGFAQFFASYSDSIKLDATSVRIDHTVNQNLTLFGRYSYAPSVSTTRGGSTSISANSLSSAIADTKTLTVGATLLVTTTTVNEFRANYSRGSGASTRTIDNLGGAVVPPDSLLFPPFTSRDVAVSNLTLLFNGNSAQYFVGHNADNLQRQINLVDTLSLVSSNHQMKFGVDYRRLFPIIFTSDYQLNLQFLNIANVRSGVVNSVLTSATEKVRPIYNNISLFGQDSWRASDRLTLTYGLRWEFNPPPHEKDGKEAFTLIGQDNPSTYALAPRGTPLYRTTYNNFAPRVGVAYQLSRSPGKEIVFRGGFGVFYDLGTNQIGLAYTGFPFTISNSQPNLPLPLTPAQLARPVLITNFSLPVAGAIYAYAPNLKLPYTLDWNLAIERSLGSNQTLTASYVAAVGRRLLQNQRRIAPNPSFTSVVTIYNNAATSDYQAMQLQYDRRLSRGLQALISYTWSHAIDDISDASTALFGAPAKSSSDFDVRHSVAAAATYNIPRPSHRITGSILGGWSLDAVFHAQSATPVNLVGRTAAVNGITQIVRPDLNLGVPLYLKDPSAPGGKRFNPAAFGVPPLGRQGTLGRNVLRGFPLNQVDFALRRQFNVTERVNLQFRAEAFNLFNHPNFGPPNNSLTGGQFGFATSMLGRSLGGLNPIYQIGGSRSLQFALKLNF